MIAGIGDQQQVPPAGDVVRPPETRRAGRPAPVLLARFPVRLAQDDVGGLIGSGNTVAPAEDPTISGIRDPEGVTDHGDPERPVEACGRTVPAPVHLHRTRTRLAYHHIGWHVIGLRHGVPHQDPVVPSVGHDEPVFMDQHSGGQVHPLFGSTAAGGGALGLTVRLSQHNISRLLVTLRQAVPDQHAVVAGVGRHQVIGPEEDPAWGVHPRHRGLRGWQRQSARGGRTEPGFADPSAGQIDRRRDITAAPEPAHIVPDGVSAHPTRTQTSPSSTRNGSASSWAPGALRHSPEPASKQNPCHGQVSVPLATSSTALSSGSASWAHSLR